MEGCKKYNDLIFQIYSSHLYKRLCAIIFSFALYIGTFGRTSITNWHSKIFEFWDDSEA